MTCRLFLISARYVCTHDPHANPWTQYLHLGKAFRSLINIGHINRPPPDLDRSRESHYGHITMDRTSLVLNLWTDALKKVSLQVMEGVSALAVLTLRSLAMFHRNTGCFYIHMPQACRDKRGTSSGHYPVLEDIALSQIVQRCLKMTVLKMWPSTSINIVNEVEARVA